MVGYVKLPASIVELLYTFLVIATPKDTVTPSRGTTLLGGIELIRASIILIRGNERNFAFEEGTEPEAAVEVDFFEKLILRKQVCEVARLDVGNDRLASEVDAIVHVAVHLEENENKNRGV